MDRRSFLISLFTVASGAAAAQIPGFRARRIEDCAALANPGDRLACEANFRRPAGATALPPAAGTSNTTVNTTRNTSNVRLAPTIRVSRPKPARAARSSGGGRRRRRR